jgi:hypothetical protein
LFVPIDRSNMSVRAYLRAPIALVWTLLGSVAIGIVVAVALRLGALAARSPVVADPSVLGGLGGFLLTVGFGAAVAAVGAVVWLPCSLAIAYAVGRRIRGEPAAFRDSVDLLRARPEPLYRWIKTRIAIEPIAGRLLSEDDVSPAEIAVGCDAFVVPALALDAFTLQRAVGLANRAIPQPGRERTLAVGLGSTGLLVAGAVAVGTVGGGVAPSTRTLALGAAILGAVLTAALDTAWRAGTYARQDLEEGFDR